MSCGIQPPANPAEVEALFPPGSVPEVRIPQLSALCAFGHTPRILTGAIRQILLQHFVDPENILDEYLRERLRARGGWSEGTDSGIVIESLARWRPELTEARPAIIIKEGDWNWRRVAIGDMAGEDWRSGVRRFGGLWSGTHTCFALADEGAETQILATEVARLLLWFGPMIMDELELHRFVPVSIGALHALKEATENYVVPVSVAYASWEGWSSQEEAPRLKRVVFKAEELV